MTKAVHSNITRRLILGSTAAVVSAAALPAAAFPLTANTAAGMTPIGRLWAQREVALKAKKLASEAEEAAYETYKTIEPVFPDDLKLTWRDLLSLPGEKEWVKQLPRQGIENRYIIASEYWREMEARLAAQPNADADILATVHRRLALTERYDREDAAAYDASGKEETTRAVNDAYSRVCDIEDAIFDAPVTCAADLAIKAQILEQRSADDRDLPDEYVLALARDAQRLAVGLSVNGGVDA